MADDRFFTRVDPITLEKVLEKSGAKIYPPRAKGVSHDTLFRDVAPLDTATSDDIAVFHNSKYADSLRLTKAGACFVTERDADKCPATCFPIVTDTPYRAFAAIATALYPQSLQQNFTGQGTVDPSAIVAKSASLAPGVTIGPGAEIGEHVQIGPNTVIGRGVVIGDGCSIGANATITHTIMGRGCMVYPGAQIGQSGFGFFMDDKGHISVPQLGAVIIEDGVEVGANSTIDRGSGHNTHIGAGSRIDNLVMIAHNVKLGKGCVIVAQVGISGSTEIGDFSAIGGQAGVTGHLKIGSGVRVAAQSGIMRDIEDNQTVGGSPAVSARQWHRQTVALEKLANNK
ncbi:MAG: UDP-3-O-(3-hydroxymyristoyl)glucosamine N-acyltransferase [Alphaproteobacteria bacterium]